MKNSRRSRLFDVFLVVTLFIGIALFILPFAFDWEQTNQRAHSETTYKQAYIPQPDGLQAKIDAYNAMIFAQQQKRPSSKVAITSIQKNLRDPIGYLDIPAIKLRAMTIYYGDSDWVLNRALGTLPFTSLPTGGKNTLGGSPATPAWPTAFSSTTFATSKTATSSMSTFWASVTPTQWRLKKWSTRNHQARSRPSMCNPARTASR